MGEPRTERPLLSDELLERIRGRADRYDAENAFFAEDLEELRDAGYLLQLVPEVFGGLGRTLEATAAEVLRLAAAAPATALALDMHLVWTGVAKTLRERGDSSLDLVLEEAGRGEIFAFAISEAGNDLVLFGSATEAVPQDDGGYALTGTKVFTSLSPAWTRLGTFGLDLTSADAPKLVHGFVRRGEGVRDLGDWDVLGMRATQSHTTVFEGAVIDAERVVRRLDPGPNADPLIFGIFTNFEILVSAVYAGLAERAVQLAVEAAHRRTSAKAGGAPLAHDPDIRWRVASAAMAADGARLETLALARDLDEQVDHGARWFAEVVGLKTRTTAAARRVVEEAMLVSGGSAFTARGELGRLYRDVLAGAFHPSDPESAHATVATSRLGPLPS